MVTNQLFLPFPAFKYFPFIDIKQSMLCMGSCFVEEVGQYLYQNYFNVQINPFGISYSPKVIAQQIQYILDQKTYTVSDLRQSEDVFFSYDHHGVFSGTDPKHVLEKINHQIIEARKQLIGKQAIMMITLGSAFFYELNIDQKVVANCHKQAAAEFTKCFQTANKMSSEWGILIEQLLELNADLKIIFTISPVRYIRDGLVENNRSKAQLFSLIESLQGKFTNSIYYFPAYEIINDCLRDYRFFKTDLVHPNAQAIEMIWDYFNSKLMLNDTREIVSEIEKLRTKTQHRILKPLSTAALEWQAQIQREWQSLYDQYPFLKLAPVYTDK
jgi:hypothetical protein